MADCLLVSDHLLVFYWLFAITSGDSQSGVLSNLGESSALNIATQVAIRAGLRCPNHGAYNYGTREGILSWVL